jgi:acetyl esterase/lipase
VKIAKILLAVASIALLVAPGASAAVRPVGVAPLAAPSAEDPPTGAVKGTMIMAFGSAWAGHSALWQNLLMRRPGQLLVEHGWRVVSIDYDEGAAGLQNVLTAAREELARKSGPGPLCIYGESSGAQLALVAASQLPSIDCVIGVATPAALGLYESDASTSADPKVRALASRMGQFFGTTPDALAPWDPIALAPAIKADVLLLHESDDPLIAPSYATRFQAVRPTTKLVMLEAGDPTDPAQHFAHGSVSDAGRARYAAEVASFADREVTAGRAERRAAGAGCPRVSRTIAEVGRRGVLSALLCLARRGARSLPTSLGTWGGSSVRMPGHLDAARLWASLGRTASGRRALAATARRRVKLTVHIGDPTRVILRRSPAT